MHTYRPNRYTNIESYRYIRAYNHIDIHVTFSICMYIYIYTLDGLYKSNHKWWAPPWILRPIE